MTSKEAATRFQQMLLDSGALFAPRDPKWLDYREPKNVFTRMAADDG